MENIKLIYIASFIALLVLIYAAIKVYKSIFLNSNKLFNSVLKFFLLLLNTFIVYIISFWSSNLTSIVSVIKDIYALSLKIKFIS